MKPYQIEFIKLAIEHKAISIGKFLLKSGRISKYFFNISSFNNGYALLKLGHIYANAIIDNNIKCDILFGPAYKGIPLVISTSMVLAEKYQINVNWCANRKEAKQYGEFGSIIGGANLYDRMSVLIIDDVITSGKAIREVINIIKTKNMQIIGVLVALNREDKGIKTDKFAIQEIENDFNIPILSLISMTEICEYFDRNM